MTIRKNLLLSVVVGLGSFPLLIITKPAEAANFHTHCAVLPYTAPSGNIPLPSLTTAAFAVSIRINQTVASQTNCPGGLVGDYEISDLTSIGLGLSPAASGSWDVKIGNNLFANQQFFSGNIVPFTIPPHQQNDAIEFNFVDNTPDFLQVTFTPVTIIDGTAIVQFRDPKGNSYYKVPEPTSTLSLLALGTLGAASTLKRKLKPSQSTEKETTKVG